MPTDPSAARDGADATRPPPPASPFLRDALLAALVDSSDEAVIAKDLDGTILSWNASAERMLGYRADEMLGRSALVFIPEERHHEEHEQLAVLRRGDRIEHFETQRIRKDGRRIDVSVSVSPIRDDAGTIVAVAKVIRDITGARIAQTLQSTLAAIVESSDDAIIGKTLDGVIMAWNASATRIFGWEALEIVGKSILTLLPPERHPEEATILATLRDGGRIEHFETERVHKDGHRLWVSLSVSPIKDASGRIVGAAKIARDITLRRTLEHEREDMLARERAARSEAEAANRSKDAFLATVSHELRTPLSPIIAWARMLGDGVLSPEKSAKAIATIDRSARALAQLIDDLLDVSRIIAGKMRIEVRPTDLGAVIQSALEVIRPAADAKGIRVQPLLDTETGVILGDPDRLQQVVWNLLSNAVKFTPRGGRVQVILERVNSHVEIAVSDTGQGFDPSFHPHLFDRFRQADGSVTRTHGGLGLGLAIVRHIVELHGGTVHAESPGTDRGATFTVKLPRGIFQRSAGEAERRHPTAAAPLPQPPVDPSRLAGVRVFVVDDEPDSNEVVSTILAAYGAEVRVAAGVAQALDGLRAWVPDLVITDIGMPNRDGYALLAAMRRDPKLERVPAIALTAYATRDDRLRILGAGFQLHLTKPIDAEELVASVANVTTTFGKRERDGR